MEYDHQSNQYQPRAARMQCHIVYRNDDTHRSYLQHDSTVVVVVRVGVDILRHSDIDRMYQLSVVWLSLLHQPVYYIVQVTIW